jgi:predicted molibdopterin-dependent oxidoreductase YjgC
VKYLINLTIDGIAVQGRRGATILETARLASIKIPTLCHLADLTPEGACRICVVQVEGQRALVASCTFPIAEGMVVHTHNADVLAARRLVLELMLANHPQDCFSCQRNLNCELQALAASCGLREVRFQGEKRQFAIDDSNPFIIRDNNKCVLCGRCVRVCKELQCCNVLEWTERGFASKVTTGFDTPTDQSDCVFCGACVSACPVGALTEKSMYNAGMPDKKVKTTCPFCGVGCNFDLNVKEGQVVGVTSNLTSAVNGRLLCVKGRFGTDYVHSPQRLTTPLIKRDGKFEEASWDEALELVAQRLTGVKKEHGADAIGVMSSARCTNEENYLLQKLTRAVIGTNNIDHCART